MYTGYNYGSYGGYGNCGCQQSYYPFYNQPSGFGFSGGNWFAIVLVVFLLLIICGCNKIC